MLGSLREKKTLKGSHGSKIVGLSVQKEKKKGQVVRKCCHGVDWFSLVNGSVVSLTCCKVEL